MSTFPLNASQRYASEVVVIGDGLAAFAAALEAAARGKQTLLAASGPAVAAELTIALFGEVGEVTDPHLAALRERVAAVGGERGGWLDPAIAQMVADQMLAEAGVQVLLWAIPIRTLEQGSRAAGVLMAGKDGLYTIAAGAIIDATTTGLLFRNTGAAFIDPEMVTASRALYFQLAGEDLSGLPDEVAGFRLCARVTAPGEVCVMLTGEAPSDGDPVPAALHRASRLAEVEVAVTCRALVPGLKDALVSHSGHQLLPLNVPCLAAPGLRHPVLTNLIGAGAWTTAGGRAELAALAACGTAAAVPAGDESGPVAAAVTLSELADLPAEQCAVGVFGGGTGGPLAAWAAARGGAQTALFEAGWSLGGIPTCGGIHWYYHGVAGGLQDLLHDTSDALADDFGGRAKVSGFHPEARKIALEQLLLADGVDLRYGWTATEVRGADDRITQVLLATPGRLLIIEPTVVIDGTGDGDVLAKAGALVMYGRESDGLSHQYSQSAACMRGGHLGHFNFDAGYVDARSTADLTRARRHALQLYWNPASFAAAERPFNVSYLLGLRQSRHVVGDYVLSLDDQVSNRHFEDVVAYGHCHQDNHAFDYENENDDAMLWCWGLGFWRKMMQHELPYRCLTPQGLSNALVACRAVSVSREAHMLFRMIRDMYRLGEAAGTAAALAVAKGGEVRAISVAELQSKLQATGALLLNWPAESVPAAPEALVAELVDELPRVAVWHLYQQGEAAVPALLTGLQSDNENTRWWCALALAGLERSEAAGVLLAALQTHDERLPKTDPNEPEYYVKRMAPRWLTAVMLLGKLQERSAVAPIAAVLDDVTQEPDRLLAAVRALGRLGDPAAVEPLSRFIARDDLPLEGEFQDSIGQRMKVPKDVAWMLHLATAEALAQLGSPAPKLVEPYLSDERVYVRDYARRLMA